MSIFRRDSIVMRLKTSLLFVLFSHLFMIQSCTPSKTPLVFGHRGARGHVAENTLPSIAKALDLGVDGIEIDIFQCASGELVVFHDQTLDKLTNTTGFIEQLDLDSIQKIEVLGGYTIPTLQEVLDLINGQVILNIELKGTRTAHQTHAILQDYFESGSWQPNQILISSFNWEELQLFYEKNKTIPIAVLTEDDPLDAIPTALALEAVAINPNHRTLNEANVKKIKAAGFQLYPWTVNTPEDIQKMYALGVDAIITDYPERVNGIP